MATWNDYNKQLSGSTSDQVSLNSWDNFNSISSRQSFKREADSQDEVDKDLFQRLKLQGIYSSDVNDLGAEKVSYPREFLRTTGSTFANFGGQMIRNIRGSSQILATPFAGLLASVPGGVTPREAMKESLDIAKNVALTKEVDIDYGVEEAARQYLDATSEVDPKGGYKPTITNVAALSMLGFFNLFGDPAFEFGVGLKSAKALKEFAQFKKVSTASKELKEGTSFVKGTTRQVELKISDDIKIKIKPQENAIVIEKFKKRFPQKSSSKMSDEATSLVMDAREATGMEMVAKFKGDDLILKPTTATGAVVQPTVKTIEPLLQEARKFKSAEEFISGQIPKGDNIVFHGTTKSGAENIEKVGFIKTKGGFNKGRGISVSGKFDVSEAFASGDVIGKSKSKDGVVFSLKIKPNAKKITTQEFLDVRNEIKVGIKLSLKETENEAKRLGMINAEQLSLSDITKLKFKKANNETYKLLEKNGFDILDASKQPFSVGADQVESVILNPNIILSKTKIKTKQQLENIWNEANGELDSKLKPEIKKSTLGLGVEEKAVEEGLVKNFNNLPEYEVVNLKEQAVMATQLLKEDPVKAVEIAMGRVFPDNGLLPEMMFNAVEQQAIKTKNVALLQQLSKSHTVSQATFMGQRIRALGERKDTSPSGIMRDIEAARAKKKMKGKKLKAERNKVIKDIKKNTKPVAKDGWEDFINSIEC